MQEVAIAQAQTLDFSSAEADSEEGCRRALQIAEQSLQRARTAAEERRAKIEALRTKLQKMEIARRNTPPAWGLEPGVGI